MYTILLLLSFIGIKPTSLRRKLREHYRNHERGHFNLNVYHKKAARRAKTPDEEAKSSLLAAAHAKSASALRERIFKLQ